MHSIKQKRKNYLPSLLITIVFWLILGFIFLKVPPGSLIVIGLFFIFLFLSLFFTLSLLLVSSKKGLLFSVGLIVLIFLKKFGQLTIVNGLLFLGIILTLNYVLKKR